MNNLTKEQIGMYTAIAAVIMLIGFFVVKFNLGFFSVAPVELIGKTGWFGTVCLILALLAPIYTCLYAYRDKKVLEPLKPIFSIKPALAYSLPLIVLGLIALGAFIDGGWPVILYAVGAICVACVGNSDKEK